MDDKEKNKIDKLIKIYNDDAIADEITNNGDKYSSEGLETLKNELKKRNYVPKKDLLEQYEKSEGKEREKMTVKIVKKHIGDYVVDFFKLVIIANVIFLAAFYVLAGLNLVDRIAIFATGKTNSLVVVYYGLSALFFIWLIVKFFRVKKNKK